MAQQKRQAKRTRSRANPILSETTPGGFILRLAPVGVSHVAHGTFWIGLLFCIGVAIIGACFLIFPHLGSVHKGVYTPPSHEPMPFLGWAILGGFAIVSIAVTLFGLSLGTRKAVVEVNGSTLTIEERGLIGRRRAEWDRRQLKAIQAGPSGFSVGGTSKGGRSRASGKSIEQLHIYLANGERVRFLTGRTSDDLDFVAEQLRNALSLAITQYDGG